jgi:Lrp/AsnC family transcriptional regulator, cysteine-sensing transcriptional activator
METKIDRIDLRILEVMQQDGSLSTAEIAERVGLSQSPCWRRIQRLKNEGYIKGIVAIVDRHKLGLNMQIFAQVKMGTLTDAQRQKFLNAVNERPEIQECYSLFGEMDVILKVLSPDVNWYQEFVFNTIMKQPSVKDVQSLMTLSEIKCTTSVPLNLVR